MTVSSIRPDDLGRILFGPTCNEDFCTVPIKECKIVTMSYGTKDYSIDIDMPMCDKHIRENQERIKREWPKKHD